MKHATTKVANLKIGDQVTFINYTKNSERTVVAVVVSVKQYKKNKNSKGDTEMIIIGSPIFNLLNTAKLYKKITKRVTKKYIIKIKLLEVIKPERKWCITTLLKQLFMRTLKILRTK